ncbi:APC family permease [Peribacillus sp. TH14]|uniref:APC family permease n=1 Tax=Peribacillus sp. TH14 TaxID=2798481 RepID=UPI001F5B26AC|nr:amino acid permease [Peribacillus sp. TH14]
MQTDLEKLGYKQELKRNLNYFDNFSIAFAFISATTGIFSLFGMGLSTGGPSFVWTWPAVFIGQLLVSLTLAEVASHYPLSGSIYNWTKHLVNDTYAWFAGWIYLVASLITIAAVNVGGAPYIAQMMGWDAGNHNTLLMIVIFMVLLQTLINSFGVKLTAMINNIGMVAEVGAMIVLAAVLLAVGIHQPFDIVFETAGTEGSGSYLPVFLSAMLMSVFVLYGFESAGSLAEEVINPRRIVPRAIISSLVITFICGGILIIALVLSISDLTAVMQSEVPVMEILSTNLGAGVANAFVILAVIAILVCGTAIQASVARLLYSLGRDRKIPGSKLWLKISPKYETPIAAILFTGIFTVLLTSASSTLSYLVNMCIAGIYIAYLSIAIGALIARKRGWNAYTSPWNLGKWGVHINILALSWLVFGFINLCWPRTPDAPWYVNYSIPLLVGCVFLIGAVYYTIFVRPRHRIEVSEEKKTYAK